MEERKNYLERSIDQQKDKSIPLDLTFITNEPNQKLKDRFEQLIKDCRFFDCLVAYFYLSGFYTLYKALQGTEKIRILVGIGTTKETYDFIKNAENQTQNQLQFSHLQTKEVLESLIEDEMANSEDKHSVEEGIYKFIEWIKEGKLQIKAYPSQKLHAKLYIMTFKEGDRDVGRVITGSSNFTQSGLIDNLEFNVELKNVSDYEYAKSKFEELWENAVDVNEEYIKTINEKSWLNQSITPYELYLKFLYEYFKDELSRTDVVFTKYLPEGFKKFEYQEQAVLNAKKILEEYGGVFISDVVGLGKTYIAAMLAGQLDGRTMVIAPPALLNRNNPGSWPNVFSDFHIFAEFVSVGNLDKAIKLTYQREYKNIIIDEAHRFRTETTISYEKLAEICRGKRVILVSATPYNNSPSDILAQIKLFQNARKSTIPGILDLDEFFGKLEKSLERIDRQKDYNKYINSETALLFHSTFSEIIRDKVIDNFDAKARNKKDDYIILVSTEGLSEDVNLHRSNIVINYDIPWKPTRLMQRVGRINHIDTPFDRIHIFKFFPIKQAYSEIDLTIIVRSKINEFLILLSVDALILTEGEPVSSNEQFDKLLSKKTITKDKAEEECELKYLRIIENIFDKNSKLFERIKRLPKKTRVVKVAQTFLFMKDPFLTFFRKGKLMKFFISDKKETKKADFLTSIKILEGLPDKKRAKLPLENYYQLLDKNKSAFFNATIEEIITTNRKVGTNSETKLLKILKVTQKNTKQLTEEHEKYLKKLINHLLKEALSKKTVKEIFNAINKLGKEIQNPLKVIGILQRKISPTFLKSPYAATSTITEEKSEVILSLYLARKNEDT